MSTLTHFDNKGQAHMVDVSAKAHTHRVAVACGRIEMLLDTLKLISSGNSKKAMFLALPASQASKQPKDQRADSTVPSTLDYANRTGIFALGCRA